MSDRQVTIVTGASQGIGRVIAVEFAKRGDVVVLAARNLDRLKETSSMVEAAGGQPMVVETDVTSETRDIVVGRLVNDGLLPFGCSEARRVRVGPFQGRS